MIRFFVIFVAMVSIITLITACASSGVPDDAKTALKEFIDSRAWGEVPNYEIVSAQRGKSEVFDELWCVTLDQEVNLGAPISHYFLRRQNLLWSVGIAYDFDKDSFLRVNCSNW